MFLVWHCYSFCYSLLDNIVHLIVPSLTLLPFLLLTLHYYSFRSSLLNSDTPLASPPMTLLLLLMLLICSTLLFLAWCCNSLLAQHYRSLLDITTTLEIIKFIITNMWKSDLKTNCYKMCENRHFETQMKLVFANFWNHA